MLIFELIEIFWQEQPVGILVNPVPDMWYMEGKFILGSSKTAEDFRKLAEQLDARLVLEDWDEGIVVELKIPTSSSFGIVHSLSEDSLFLRRIYARENIEWASKQYKG